MVGQQRPAFKPASALRTQEVLLKTASSRPATTRSCFRGSGLMVQNCVIWQMNNASVFQIGSGIAGDLKNITVRNSDVIRSEWAWPGQSTAIFAANQGGSGNLSNYTFGQYSHRELLLAIVPDHGSSFELSIRQHDSRIDQPLEVQQYSGGGGAEISSDFSRLQFGPPGL